MNLALSPAAGLDLQSISDYTLRIWGEGQETRYLDGIWRKLEEIRACPEDFKLRPDLTEDCRSARCGRHVIFFSVNGDTVEVIRILHAAMDFQSHLLPEQTHG